jgi:hypothetical protein
MSDSVNQEVKQEEQTSVVNTVQDVGNYDDDMKKYTKIDNLDEDPVVESGKFFLVSFISPEGVMNCKMRGLKIRTYKNRVTFATLEEAKAAADEINQKDKYFHVFVGETGKWMGWDPAPDDRNFVEEEKWADKEQDELMQEMRKREENKLKELNALVGKKKAIVDKEKKTHKKRVASALKESAANVKASKEKNKEQLEQPEQNQQGEQSGQSEHSGQNHPTEDLDPNMMTEEQVQEEQRKVVDRAKKTHNPALVKERLRQKLQEKNKKTQKEQMNTLNTQGLNNAKQELAETGETKTKLDENIKKLNSILEKAKQTESVKN